MSLPNKYPAEIVTVAFDFSHLATTLSSPVVTCTASSGLDDDDPAALLSGDPVVSGLQVLQRVVGGQAGTTYKLACLADDADGERWLVADTMAVIAP